MAYATVNDLLVLASTHRELADLTQQNSGYDIAILQAELEAASAMVDIYATVVNNADAFIRHATCKIAIYYLFQRSNVDIPQPVLLGFQESIALLKDLSLKQVKVAGATSNFDTTKPRGKARTIAPLHLHIMDLI